MAYRPPVNVGAGTALPRTGPSFARARLVLAQRAGYLPAQTPIASGSQAMQQWRQASTNLAARARGAGFSNPMQWLRQGAANGNLPGTLQARTSTEKLPMPMGPPPINNAPIGNAASNLHMGSMQGMLGQQVSKANADPRLLGLIQAMLAQGNRG